MWLLFGSRAKPGVQRRRNASNAWPTQTLTRQNRRDIMVDIQRDIRGLPPLYRYKDTPESAAMKRESFAKYKAFLAAGGQPHGTGFKIESNRSARQRRQPQGPIPPPIPPQIPSFQWYTQQQKPRRRLATRFPGWRRR
jgi:hypothetical protein